MNITSRQLEAAKVWDDALRGDRTAQLRVKEGISTSDFPTQISPVLNQILLEQYAALPKVWDTFATKLTLDDFRPQKYFQFKFDQATIPASNGGVAFLEGSLPNVGEYDEYPTLSFSATDQSIAVRKSGERIRFSWESIVNDNNFGVLERLPNELALHAAGLEDMEATKQLVSASGLNTTNFNATNQNVGSVANGAGLNPTLTINNLQLAMAAINKQTYNGRTITPIQRYTLVVPQALEMTARNILSVTEIRTTVGSALEISGNPIAGMVDIVVNPWLTRVNTDASAATTWFLIPAPATSLNPSVVLAFLRGYDVPELRIKDTNSYTLAGGEVPVRDGSFDNDDFQMRIRHLATGNFLVPAGTFGSKGTGIA
jgi:hypothetical protein